MAACNFSPHIIKSWEKTGKKDFVKKIQDETSTLWKNDIPDDVYACLWWLLEKCISGDLSTDQVASTIGEIVLLHTNMASWVVDVLVVFDMETQCKENGDQRERFTQLLQAATKYIPDSLIKERLDIDTLGEANIVKAAKSTHSKFVKIKTRLYYKQNKYNLFREESEGYAKLITELGSSTSSTHTPQAVEYMLDVIRSLIGCFNLDPNRVLDVILEALENQPDRAEFFVALLKKIMLNSTSISQVLGFKFSFYQTGELSRKTPESLYKVAALLIKHQVINLEQIYGLLVPDDQKIVDHHKKDREAARAYARKTLYSVNPEATPSMTSSSNTGSQQQQDGATIAGDAMKDDASNALKDSGSFVVSDNQKLGLCAALLDVGDWKSAKQIIDHLPEYYAVSKPLIARKLCRLVHIKIDPLYRKHNGLPKGFSRAFCRRQPNQCESFADFQRDVIPMIVALGPMLHTDPVLGAKILRLGRAYMQQLQKSPSLAAASTKTLRPLEYDILTVLDEALFPSLSLWPGNCCMAEEFWTLLKLYPYQQRYRLYANWKSDLTHNHPLLIRKRAEALKRTKYIMKRLSKENVKPSGRQIGKLSHSNPCLLFDYLLTQIQQYDNLIGPVVDSLKFLTSLSYDVLVYCIIEGLTNPEKDRTKTDGTTIAPWLQSLANFCGAMFKKYNIELAGLLQLIANQLKAGKSLDLLVLKDIVQKMAGVEASDQTTPEQLEAMSGGELLRAEGAYFNQLRNTKKSSQRLKDALIEQDLALPLCLLMAQQKDCILYREQEDSHLKLVGKLFDQCQDTLVQFGTFLSVVLTPEEYVKGLPSMSSLLSDYHVLPDVAFFLARPLINYQIVNKFEEVKRAEKGSFKSLPTQQRLQRYVDSVNAVLSQVVDSVRPLFPPKMWEDLNPSFYVTFWTLTLYDIDTPTASYERECGKLRNQMQSIEDSKDIAPNKRKKEKERCSALVEKLQEEERRQQDHCTRVMARLKMDKDLWFASSAAKTESMTKFIQYCLFPRCLFSALDAVYCAKFVHLVHALKTAHFSTLICYDKIFCDISYTITSCTENEAARYGRFLVAMMATVMRWHSEKAIFEKECAGFPGFMTKFRGANSAHHDASSDHVDYENFRHVCHKWHFKLTKALVTCLESGEYVQIRNSLIVLTKMVTHFPMITNLGQALSRRIEQIRVEQKEKRPDLFALATSYSGMLKVRSQHYVLEQEFHLKEVKPAPVKEPKAPKAASATGDGRKLSATDNKAASNAVGSKSDSRSTSSGTTAAATAGSGVSTTVVSSAQATAAAIVKESAIPANVKKEKTTGSRSAVSDSSASVTLRPKRETSATRHENDADEEYTKKRKVESNSKDSKVSPKNLPLEEGAEVQQRVTRSRDEEKKTKKSSRKRQDHSDDVAEPKRKRDTEDSKSSKRNGEDRHKHQRQYQAVSPTPTCPISPTWAPSDPAVGSPTFTPSSPSSPGQPDEPSPKVREKERSASRDEKKHHRSAAKKRAS